jgi:hypothetical protein
MAGPTKRSSPQSSRWSQCSPPRSSHYVRSACLERPCPEAYGGAQGSQEQQEGPLSARPSEWRTRYGGCGTRKSGASAALILARLGRTVVVGLMLTGSVAPALAHAAAADPSPPLPAAAGTAAPSPDPPPQAQAQGQSQAPPATPRPTESGVALGSPASEPSTVALGRVTGVPLAPVSVAPRSRPVSNRAHGRASRTAGRSAGPHLQEHSRGVFDAIAGVAARPPTPHRNGVLLLLSALALWTVVIASSSLLRLVGRIRDGSLE